MNKSIFGILLLATCLWLPVQLRAESPLDGANAREINATQDGCQFTVTPLVQAVVEKITSGYDLKDFWNSAQHLAELLREIEALRLDGLNPEHYHFSLIQPWSTRVSNSHSLTACETAAINLAYVRALKDLHFGRVDPAATQLVWYADGVRQSPSVTQLLALAKAGIDGDIQGAFEAARPVSAEYRGLRDAYQQALADLPLSWTRVRSGSMLEPGDVDPRIAAIRQRLAESGYWTTPPADTIKDQTFSPQLVDAVRAFQVDHGLRVDGVIGPETIAAMNVQPTQRLDQFRVNLERMRWYLRDKEDTMVLVDIAGTEISYIHECNQRILTRVILGRPYRKTPPLKSAITHVTLNPTWTVPPGILWKDVLPAVRKDLNYLSEKHIRVLDHLGNELDPETIDWNHPGRVILRQDPGPQAALGEVALRFPNPFFVFLHDTPSKELFDTDKRFYSSGCVRVENAMTLTEVLFEDAPQTLLEDFIEAWSSEKPVDVSLPVPVPLLMVYRTAIVDEDGKLRLRPDIYKRDGELLNLLEQP